MQKFTVVLVLVLSPLFLIAQSSVKDNIDLYANNFQQERLYIQFDKPAYAPGETIWYKIYILAGTYPSVFSTNIYLDIADTSGKVLSHAVMPVVQSSAQGSFDIPKSFAGNFLHINSYTKWMLNFDSSFLYNKEIRIVQPLKNSRQALVQKPVIQFFPESGESITGIKGRIAFKASFADGRPCNVKGEVVNSKGENVAAIETVHDGMGSFYLEPKAGENYSAKWKDEKGTPYETKLPEIKETGVHIEVKTDNGKRGFVIQRSENAPGNLKELHIVATIFQHLVYMATVNLNLSPAIGGSIPTANLPSGILQITLFDSNWMAVAERITFINNNDYHFEPEVGFSALGTGKRGKNTLVINIPDSLESNLSVAVTDAGIGADSSENIISRLLLTDDLRGSIYNPYYYFTDSSAHMQNQLDLVMLTNGWRRIKWEEIVKGKMPEIKYPNDTSYLTLSGKVFGASAQDLRESALLLMILESGKDSARKPVQTILDKDGTFSIPDIVLTDTTKIYYHLAGTRSMTEASEVTFNGMMPLPKQINFDKNKGMLFSDTAEENRLRFFADEQARLQKFLEGTTLKNVTVKAKTKSPMEVLDEKYTSGLFSGGQAREFDVLNDPFGHSSYNVFNYLQGKVAGLNISSGAGNPTATWRGGTPSFFMDEVPVDISQLATINMSNIAYVKVFEPPFFGAIGGGASGAIAVYTQRGGPVDNRPAKGLPYKLVIGYAPEKEFYSPDYAVFDQRNESADLRSTLYWNPMVITTTENHILKFNFYDNDFTNSFRVIVEGVSKEGRLTHIEKVIE